MKAIAIGASIGLVGILAAGAVLLTRGPDSLEHVRIDLGREIEGLRKSVEAQGRAAEALAARLGALERAARAEGADRKRSAAPGDEAVAAAVARWMEAHPEPGARKAAGAKNPEPAEGEAGAEPVDVEEAVNALVARAPWDERQHLWRKLARAGRLDEAIALLEKRAKETPDDPEVHAGLGMACVQKIRSETSEVQKGALAMKADRAFDAALAIDPDHWEARFSKATTLAFWPPIFGKGPEAISQFEKLIERQETQPAARPEFAQSYLFLGNLHSQGGDREKALAVWRKGAALFPGDAGLAERLASAEKR